MILNIYLPLIERLYLNTYLKSTLNLKLSVYDLFLINQLFFQNRLILGHQNINLLSDYFELN